MDTAKTEVSAQGDGTTIARTLEVMDRGFSEGAKSSPDTMDIESSCEKLAGDDDLAGTMEFVDGLGEMISGHEHSDTPKGSTIQVTTGDIPIPGTVPGFDMDELSWPNLCPEQLTALLNFDQPCAAGSTPFEDVGTAQWSESRDCVDHGELSNAPGAIVLSHAGNGSSHIGLPPTSGKRCFGSLGASYENTACNIAGGPAAKRSRVDSHIAAFATNVAGTTVSTRASSENGGSLTVKLNFKTEKRKTTFGNLVSQKLARELGQGSRRILRTRDETASIDKVALTKAFKNKPIARGCWACVQLEGAEEESQCSLLEDHGHYPCHACTQDGVRCELITPPHRKVSCVDCRRRNLTCSYTYTRNHDQGCQQCAEDGHLCVADPAKDGITPRIGIMKATIDTTTDEGEGNDRYVPTVLISAKKGKAKVPEDCRECTHSGEPCHYPTNVSGGPCLSCKTEGLACTMPHAPAPTLSAAAPQVKPPAAPPRTEPTKPPAPTRPRKDSAVQGVARSRNLPQITRIVKTSFCHPMVFNSASDACLFCIEPDMQTTGFGTKLTEIADFEDCSGFAEISGGHKEDGMPNTRICAECTMSRFSILPCDPHAMQPIPGIHHTERDHTEATARLLEGDQDLEKYCHVCLRLASYSCCTAESEDEDLGCGLQLCDTCQVKMVGEHDGNLSGLIAEMVDQDQDCRADVELLSSDGPLARYMLWQARRDAAE
jgi:hypothetical protein